MVPIPGVSQAGMLAYIARCLGRDGCRTLYESFFRSQEQSQLLPWPPRGRDKRWDLGIRRGGPCASTQIEPEVLQRAGRGRHVECGNHHPRHVDPVHRVHFRRKNVVVVADAEVGMWPCHLQLAGLNHPGQHPSAAKKGLRPGHHCTTTTTETTVPQSHVPQSPWMLQGASQQWTPCRLPLRY
jgi:hypothetical protein